MQRFGSSLFALPRQQCQSTLVAPNVQRFQQALFSGTKGAKAKKENLGQADSETTKGVAAGEGVPKTPGGAPEGSETTSQAAGGSVRPGYDPTGKNKGQQPATQEKQNPQQGHEPSGGDPSKAKTFTTASAAWHQGSARAVGSNSPALAKGPWGQSRGFFSGRVVEKYQRPSERSNTGSDQGKMQDGGDINTGSGTGGPSSGLPQDIDPKDATNTDRIDDPEELFKRRRAKDPEAFDKVHGKGSTLHAETDGHVQGKDDTADKMTNQDATAGLGGNKGKAQTMQTNTQQAPSLSTWTRAFFSSAYLGGLADEAQKKAGNPYAPTDSAGGTPADKSEDHKNLSNEAKQAQMSSEQEETDTQPGASRMPKNSGDEKNKQLPTSGDEGGVQTGNSLDKDAAVSPEGVGGP